MSRSSSRRGFSGNFEGSDRGDLGSSSWAQLGWIDLTYLSSVITPASQIDRILKDHLAFVKIVKITTKIATLGELTF